MKKFIALGICLAVMSTAAFAQVGMSAGIGGFYSALESTWKYTGNSGSSNYSGFGVFGFFDAAYVEVDVGAVFGTQVEKDHADYLDFTHFTLGLVGKYPIALNDKFTVFPLVGFDYNIFLSGEYFSSSGGTTTFDRSDLDDGYQDSYDKFNIVIGGGVDYYLNQNFYIRAELRWGFRLLTKYEEDWIDADSNNSSFSHGPKVSLAVGGSI
jgi:outer membrane protein W